MSTPEFEDKTPIVGAQTDIAPLGRSGQKPAHELTAAEERGNINWDEIAEDSDFKKLLIAKAAFVVPTTAFFIIYYFALPLLVGWFPDLMKTKVGNVNVAYLFALSQFFMAWIIAGLYVVQATGWDKAAAGILAKFKH
jgi:uncharacterized membrane protein (DUF485 family)